MSEENVKVVRCLYDTWNRTGGEPQWDLIDPDIEVEFKGGILIGKYHGHAGLDQALDAFWSSFDESRIEVESCGASGEDVLVTLRYFARGKASGIKVAAAGWHLWTVQGGKAVRWLVFGTQEEAVEAAGLRE
jgi:ketosteroid isomerase-like protein